MNQQADTTGAPSPESTEEAVHKVIGRHPEGIGLRGILDALAREMPRHAVRYCLRKLAAQGRIVMHRSRRWATYTVNPGGPSVFTPGSARASEVAEYVNRPYRERSRAEYRSGFLEQYQPNETFYLSEKDRAHLRKIGEPPDNFTEVGAYARKIFDRLLIDLSWNSSRLEGNTLTLLDTVRLIEFGKIKSGKVKEEVRMILNHKRAIELLVDESEGIRFNRDTLLNLHAFLADGLLRDEGAEGQLRQEPVIIGGSTYTPLGVPQQVEDFFDLMLQKADAVSDPFEQSLFVLAHLAYLQPFIDVNKRVSRLASNIPLIRDNLVPHSFIGVERTAYLKAILGVYELNDIALLRELYIWSYKRSVERYADTKRILGDPDPIRVAYRDDLNRILGEVVREKMGRQAAFEHVAAWANSRVKGPDRKRFREVAESELLSLHLHQSLKIRVTEPEFEAWERVWAVKPTV